MNEEDGETSVFSSPTLRYQVVLGGDRADGLKYTSYMILLVSVWPKYAALVLAPLS